MFSHDRGLSVFNIPKVKVKQELLMSLIYLHDQKIFDRYYQIYMRMEMLKSIFLSIHYICSSS